MGFFSQRKANVTESCPNEKKIERVTLVISNGNNEYEKNVKYRAAEAKTNS